MKQNRERAIDTVILMEGGFAERENEPGGACNMGVSLQVFREIRPGANIEDLKAMTHGEASAIYDQRYASAIGFDNLPSGYDLMMLHCAVMFGPSGAIKFNKIANGDMGYLATIMMWDKMHRPEKDWHFMAGWANRIKAVYEIAKSLTDRPT